jgi:hypothetical protein
LGGGDITTDVEDGSGTDLPEAFRLYQNYPNPFNPETSISYRLSVSAWIVLSIYDVRGHTIRRYDEGEKWGGDYEVVWDGRDGTGRSVASGMYFCRVEMRRADGSPSFVAVRKMLLMK